MSSIQDKVAIWVLINCCLPILPIFLILLGIWFGTPSAPKNQFKPWVTLTQILGDGQLFFYCTSLSAGTISDLANNLTNKTIPSSNPSRDVLSISVLLIFVVFTALFYGQVIRIRIENPNNNDASRKTTLVSIFVSVVITFIVLNARNQGGLFK